MGTARDDSVRPAVRWKRGHTVLSTAHTKRLGGGTTNVVQSRPPQPRSPGGFAPHLTTSRLCTAIRLGTSGYGSSQILAHVLEIHWLFRHLFLASCETIPPRHARAKFLALPAGGVYVSGCGWCIKWYSHAVDLLAHQVHPGSTDHTVCRQKQRRLISSNFRSACRDGCLPTACHTLKQHTPDDDW